MSTLVLVSTNGIALAVGAAVMYLPAVRKLTLARLVEAHADATFDAAEALADTIEANRNKPWHYAAELPPAADHEGEVLHVEHPTGEIHRPTLDDLAEEVALVQLLDRPAEDEDEVGDEQPGEATSTALPRLRERLWDWLFNVLAEVRDFFKSDAQREAEDRRRAEIWTGREWADVTEYRAEESSYKPRHWNDVTAMHGIVTPGRHRAEVEIPAQRDGGES